jgi:hypothetical protein
VLKLTQRASSGEGRFAREGEKAEKGEPARDSEKAFTSVPAAAVWREPTRGPAGSEAGREGRGRDAADERLAGRAAGLRAAGLD